MNSITIIVVIVALLACLVCYAFVSQTLEQKRQHRQRLLTALQLRANSFKYMLNNFPPGFLSRDLMLLVQRTLVDMCEQMMNLEPKNAAHKQDLQAVTQQMNETRRQAPKKPQVPTLESAQQIKDTRQSLEELYKVVYHQEARGDLSASEATAYRAQIRELVLGLTVDAYILQGHRARQEEKVRLADHYYSLARKLLQREDTAGTFQQRLARLEAWLKELRSKASELHGQDAVQAEDMTEQVEIDKAWENFNQAEEGWKKKNLYD